ncbi:unnamed protein product [Fraxinus pennsylvanica]|uniref:Uncharacterized protein n=1 Tax=Fraxinus pennsylvanica TaxID=56036 RepID=A0AAD1ZTJ8_9LAMI|nr:unnamed protein product [Fraxinus pennsylvanica]
MTGDVLPYFDAFSMVVPDDSACIVTVPITLDIASDHEEEKPCLNTQNPNITNVRYATLLGVPARDCGGWFLTTEQRKKDRVNGMVNGGWFFKRRDRKESEEREMDHSF